MRRISQLLLSVRTALVLILLLTVSTFIGTMLMQAPSTVPLGGAAYAQWVETIRPRFGMWTDLLSQLGFFFVFRSLWYEALVAALAISIAYCSLHRLHTISRETFRPVVRLAPAAFERAGVLSREVSAGTRASADELRSTLARRGYRVMANERDGVVQLYADRNRWARFGTLVAHVSLVLLLVAAAVGAKVSWSDPGFVVPEGSTREVGIDGLALHVNSFSAEYYESGEPKDFRSDVVLYRAGVEVARKTIRVNDPLEYDGVRFYQSFFGPAAYLRVTDGGGRVVLQDGVAMAWQVDNTRPAGSLTVPDRGVTAYVIAPSSSGRGDTLITPGQVRLEVYTDGASAPVAMRNLAVGDDLAAAGLEFAFEREQQFTGLSVARDPTLPFIWLASVLLVVGITAVFGFPFRRVWARVAPTAGGSRVSLLTIGRRPEETRDELAELAEEAARVVEAQKE